MGDRDVIPLLKNKITYVDKSNKRFVILGLPRSGTTYLASFLNTHPDIFCSGEQYNPYAVIGSAGLDDSHETVLVRDKDPVAFMTTFFASKDAAQVSCAGFKFMIGHNIQVLRYLEQDPDITIIHVWRENRVAQAASLLKALRSDKWTQVRKTKHIDIKVDASPRKISQHWHEYETYDHLIGQWMNARPNPKITLEYCELFEPDFQDRICTFLGVNHSAKMKSRLVKQGVNTILDRFMNPKPIRYYFTQIGKAHWLDNEL